MEKRSGVSANGIPRNFWTTTVDEGIIVVVPIISPMSREMVGFAVDVEVED